MPFSHHKIRPDVAEDLWAKIGGQFQMYGWCYKANKEAYVALVFRGLRPLLSFSMNGPA